MSRLIQTLKNRSNSSKSRKARQKERLEALKGEQSFQANLDNYMKYIDAILETNDVESVTVHVNDKCLGMFNEARYSSILAGYNIVPSRTSKNEFEISLNFI